MRIFLLISLVFSVSLNCYTQQFNVLYDYDNYANDGSTIFNAPFGHLTLHSATNFSTSRLTTLISGLDFEGWLLFDASLTTNTELYTQSINNFGIVSIDEQEYFWVFGNHFLETAELYTPFLCKVHFDGLIENPLTFNEFSSQDLRMGGGIRSSSSIFIFCNHFNTGSTVIIETDLSGNYITHFILSVGFYSYPNFITDAGDGLVIGGRFLPNISSTASKQYVRKLDYDGNVLWTNEYSNGNDQLGAVNAVPLPNGNVLFASSYTNGEPETAAYQPYVGEIDNTTGDTLWTRRYLNADSTHKLYNFKRLSSGEYIGVGETFQYSPDIATFPYVTKAFIMKLDSEFNLLWHRHYIPIGYAGGPIMDPICKLNDFVENEDGGITALGMAFTYTGTGLQSGYIQDSWLLRVDSEGCLVSGCAMDITEHENDKHLFIYPNPASDVLNIQFPHIDKWQVSLYNMQGALVKEEQSNPLLQYSMDVQGLPSGVYTVLCKDNKGTVLSEKVVKQ